jgi:two-component system response regulator RegA
METTLDQKSLLIVDDDDVLRSALSRAIYARGLRVETAANFREACEVIDRTAPDLAVVDLRMPGRSGLELLVEISRRSPRTKAVVLTGYGSIANAVEAMRLGAVNYVTKPADADQILHAFEAEKLDACPEDFQRPSLAETEWNHIQKVLADCDGNITHAARILDIPRRTLQRKLRKRAP